MKYNYSVKVNGKWYRPNEEVPESAPNKETAETLPEVTEKKKGAAKK